MSLRLNAASSKEQAANAYKAAAAAYGAAAEAYLQAAKDCEESDGGMPAGSWNAIFADARPTNGHGGFSVAAPAAAPMPVAPPLTFGGGFAGLPSGAASTSVSAAPYVAGLGAPNTIYGFPPMPLQGANNVEYVAVPKAALEQILGYQAQPPPVSPALAAVSSEAGVVSAGPLPAPTPVAYTPVASPPLPTSRPAPPPAGAPVSASQTGAVYGSGVLSPPAVVAARASTPLTYTGLPTPCPPLTAPATPITALPSETIAAMEAAVGAAARLPPRVATDALATPAPAPGFAAMRFNGANP